MGSPPEPLHVVGRAYIYAIHGHFAEMLFATVIMGGEWTFPGVTGLWPLFLYGAGGLALEGIHLSLRGDCCLLTRCTLYTLCIFLCQFCLGALLRAVGACPWDYTGFRFNLLGLVALEHSLVWFVGSLLLERLVIRNTLRLRLEEPWRAKETPAPRFELQRD
ncbi:transmembrane protein 229B [Pogona vitticeps]|nr:transmembrane protein 229B-like [Pogona vitticeps]